MKTKTKSISKILETMLLIIILAVASPVSGAEQESSEDFAALVLRKSMPGDFESVLKRRLIRILLPYSKTYFFFDKATKRGATHDLVKAFEKDLNEEFKTRHLKIHAVFIPTPRDRLIPDLAAGKGDIAAGNLTITEKRLKLVDFSAPFTTGINEILVTGPASPEVKSFSDLGGKEIYVRKSSSYHESLVKANEMLKSKGKEAIKIILADEHLEDEDLLEMLNAGLIHMMVIDSHKGEFWARIFEKVKIHPDIRFRDGASIAWAIQKNTPEFKKRINAFVKENKKGTLMGNMIFNRYLKNNKYIINSQSDKDRERFKTTVQLFKKYADQYRFDWLMLAALAYQESGIDQSKKSPSGAIGVMQVLPSTARDKNVNIPNIDQLESNIHAGTKYLRFMADRYFSDPAISHLDQALLTFAAYNAGPARIAKLRKEAKQLQLDPNQWFQNVEVVAAKRIGRETVQYVSNIFKYYVAYTLVNEKNKIIG